MEEKMARRCQDGPPGDNGTQAGDHDNDASRGVGAQSDAALLGEIRMTTPRRTSRRVVAVLAAAAKERRPGGALHRRTADAPDRCDECPPQSDAPYDTPC